MICSSLYLLFFISVIPLVDGLHKPHGGTCGLFGWNRSWRKCAVGYELAAQAQGKGYMGEALSAAIQWGLDTMALNRIEAQIHPDNSPSIKLAESLGFVNEGRLRELGHWGGQFHDMLQYSLLKHEWRNAQALGCLDDAS